MSLNTGNAILSNAITVDGSYNVGIGGAANASYKLAVTGAGLYTGNLNINGETLTIGGTTNNAIINNIASVRVNIDCDNTGTGESFTIGHNQTGINDSNVLFRVQDNGNVGIGTSTPSQKLSIAYSDGGAQTTIYNTSTGHSVFANNTADKDINYQVTGTGGHYFATAGLGRVSILSNGNVGIGTSSPAVHGNAGYTTLTIQSAGTNRGWLEIGTATASSSGNIFGQISGFNGTNARAGEVRFIDEGATNKAGIEFAILNSGTITPAMRITSDGKLNHTTTSQSFGGIQTGNATSGGETSMGFISGVSSFGGTPTSVNGDQYVWAIGLGVYGIGGNYFGFASKSDTWRVKLAYNGTSWTGNSDIRLKNIEGYIENAITKVNSLSAIYYNFKSEKNPKRRVGLIAQELLEVLPEVVDIPENEFNEDGQPNYLGVQYVEVVPLLVAAIKELSAKVTALENTITDQQQQINQLINK